MHLKKSKRKVFTLLNPLLLSACGSDNVKDFLSCNGKSICGREDADTLIGTSANDLIYGFFGDDQIDGLSGDDLIKGHNGNDIINAGDGNDQIEGGPGDDKINGMAGIDYILGGSGSDTIDGGQGDDTIYGGQGDDTLNGGSGSDIVFGDDGNDLIYFELADELVSGGAGEDTVRFDATTNTLDVTFNLNTGMAYYTELGNVFQKNLNSIENFESTVSSNLHIVGAVETTKISTGSGNDLVEINSRYQTSKTGYVSTGSGNDRVLLKSFEKISLDLGVGDDAVEIMGGFDTINGGDGSDTLIVSAFWTFENTTISLQDGAVYSLQLNMLETKYLNTLNSIENVTIQSDKPFKIIGNDQDNVILGSNGNDVIEAASGIDFIDGGLGSDTIVLTESIPSIDTVVAASSLESIDQIIGWDVNSVDNSGDILDVTNPFASSSIAQIDLTSPVTISGIISACKSISINDRGLISLIDEDVATGGDDTILVASLSDLEEVATEIISIIDEATVVLQFDNNNDTNADSTFMISKHTGGAEFAIFSGLLFSGVSSVDTAGELFIS